MSQCLAKNHVKGCHYLRCILDRGHSGKHVDRNMTEWEEGK